jgi:hypothetical protein
LHLKKREWLAGLVIIAASYGLAVYVQFQYLTLFNTTLQTAIFFIPAAVRVFSVIVFGYWAGLGIALGTIIHDSIFNIAGITLQEMLGIAAEQGLVVTSSLFIWALISKKISGLKNPEIDFDRIDAFDVLAMCVVQAIINSTAGHLFFAWSPTIRQQFDPYYYAVMLIGDITGAFFVFIVANVVFSILLRTGVVQSRDNEKDKNQNHSE